MNLPSLFRDSVYNPVFYTELLAKPFSFSFKYFSTLTLTLALALTILTSITLLPAAYAFLREAGPRVLSLYPKDLEVGIKNGELTTNQVTPYAIPMPQEEREEVGRVNIAVIDTENDFSISRFDAYDTLVLLTRHEIVVREKNGSLRIQPLKDAPDFTVNGEMVENFVRKLEGISGAMIPLILIFLVLMVALGFSLALASFLIQLVVGALLVWILMKMRNIEGGYGKAYQISLHASSVSLVLFAVSLLGIPSSVFFSTLIFIMIAWINLGTPEELASPAT